MRVKYRGLLNRSAAPPAWVLPIAAEARLSQRPALYKRYLEEKKKALAHQDEGLRLLLMHYQIDDLLDPPEIYFRELAIAMAKDHVEYFKRRKPRTPTWTREKQARLILDIWAIQDRGKKRPRTYPDTQSIRGACAALVAEGKYKQRGLLQRYKEAMRDSTLNYCGKHRDDPEARRFLIEEADRLNEPARKWPSYSGKVGTK